MIDHFTEIKKQTNTKTEFSSLFDKTDAKHFQFGVGNNLNFCRVTLLTEID